MSVAPQFARADGCYFPEKAVKKMPAIPLQRAILVYRDQTERLIIESILDAEGQRFGWIVPVPATPTKIETASSGLLQTLSLATQPEITHDNFGNLKTMMVFAIAVALWALLSIRLNRPTPARLLVGLATTLLLACFVNLPTLGRAASPGANRASAGVNVEAVRLIGSYEVTLLQADSPEALSLWLEENGFAILPAEGNVVVADYIKQNWHFVAAKLQRDGQGLARPHPLSITFPSTDAVYPMRLTALAGSPVALELYVVAEQQGSAERLTLEYSNTFSRIHGSFPSAYHGGPEIVQFEAPSRTIIGQPSTQAILWGGCCVTRLAGQLNRADMANDIVLRWESPFSYRPHAYSPQGARHTAAIWALTFWTVGFPIVFLVANRRAASDHKPRIYWTWAIRPTLIACILLYLGIYVAIPTIEVNSINPRLRWEASTYQSQETADKVMMQINSVAVDAFRKAIAEHLRQVNALNPYTGQPVIEEDSPGNYTLHTHADGVILTWYDGQMQPTEYYIGRQAPPQPSGLLR